MVTEGFPPEKFGNKTVQFGAPQVIFILEPVIPAQDRLDGDQDAITIWNNGRNPQAACWIMRVRSSDELLAIRETVSIRIGIRYGT